MEMATFTAFTAELTTIHPMLASADVSRPAFANLVLVLLLAVLLLLFNGGYRFVGKAADRPTYGTAWFDVLISRVLPGTAYALALDEWNGRPLVFLPAAVFPLLLLLRASVVSMRRSIVAIHIVRSLNRALAYLIFEASIVVNAVRHLPVLGFLGDYIYFAQFIFTASKFLNSLRKSGVIKTLFENTDEDVGGKGTNDRPHPSLEFTMPADFIASGLSEVAFHTLSEKLTSAIQPELDRIKIDILQHVDQSFADLRQQLLVPSQPVSIEPAQYGRMPSMAELTMAVQQLAEGMRYPNGVSATPKRRLRANGPTEGH